MIKRILFIAAIASILLACNKDKTQKRSMGHEYYPLEDGLVWFYHVDSTFYDNFTGGTATHYTFELKDTITGHYVNLTGDRVYFVQRFKKDNTDNKWHFQRSITRSISSIRAEENIDNQIFIKFSFPPALHQSWNGNAKNTLDKQEYTITDFPTAVQVGNTLYNDAAVVLQSNEVNLLTENVASEIYAKNVGLIKKSVRDIKQKNMSTGQILHGSIYTIELKN